MGRPDLESVRLRIRAICARLFFGFQLVRLSADRALGEMFAPRSRHRVVATASWSFPIDSQTFVYQELTQLIAAGFRLKFLYSDLNRHVPLSSQFGRLWHARRRLLHHPDVCDQSYEYFARRVPERIEMLVSMLSRASGMSPETVRDHPHFRQAFAFARMVDAYRPNYLHSYFFYEGSLFVLVASCLLDIPRGVSCYTDHMLDDYALKVVALHLRQSRVVIVTSERIKAELLRLEPETAWERILVKPNGIDAAHFHELFHGLLTPQRQSVMTTGDPRDRQAKPLVSVIIIFLDAERFIREAIDSVLAQSYDRWELLLVDDGSTDGSTNIARSVAAEQPTRIRYLDHDGHQNRGMSATRNAGVANAAGDYVAFLDADDVWLPVKLEQQVEILESHPDAAMVFGAAEYWHSWTGAPEDVERDAVPSLGVEADRLFRPPSLSLLLHPLGTGTAPCPSDICLRRDAFTRVGGFEESFRGDKQLYEDQAFLAKLYLRECVFISSKSWIRYRIHAGSCVSGVISSGQYEVVRGYFLDWLEKHLRAHDIHDEEVWRALEQAQQQHRSSGQPTAPQTGSESSENLVQFGTLRRLSPISRHWGFDRGNPIDRYYIEQFLDKSSADIRGRVLEIGDDAYTTRFGRNQVTVSDVLHVVAGNPRATIVGDLTSAEHVPSDTFDCVILTQTLQLIYDTRAALDTLHRILKPDGVLLATFPGLSRISHEEWVDSWFWQFTTASARRLFEAAFPGGEIGMKAYGNVLAASAFLYGLAAEELRKDELDYCDPDYQVLITVRAVKASSQAWH